MDFFQVSFLKLPNPFSQSETIIMSSFTYNVMIQSFGDPEMFDPNIRFTYINTTALNVVLLIFTYHFICSRT